MHLSFCRFTRRAAAPKIAPQSFGGCAMHELARFHYNRRRLAPEVFDFDRASVQLLALFKVTAQAGLRRYSAST